ncbi:Whirly transcription factor [Chlorella sorokiniana]|uniref:Whirly transcription factor n=1 Tax=Chlorella sorokiniana TaxID=3076 RepID=A0A2P6TTS7_CHLSO|nr:Whirly transcription factor [Chlorella sorokiniana]|eukprot:PRW57453.1 Whirly transcription factor [Chlorella sorokiniana]
MALKVIKPTWQQIGSGLAIEREGTVLLEFAKSTGPKSYAWDQKETFGLSALECAAVLEAADKHQPANFVHDPYKGGEGEGRIIKTLRVSPAKEQGWGFNVNVKEGGADKASIYCSVSDAELRLIKTLLAFLVPRLLGFDEHFQGAPSVLEPSQGAGEAGGAPF